MVVKTLPLTPDKTKQQNQMAEPMSYQTSNDQASPTQHGLFKGKMSHFSMHVAEENYRHISAMGVNVSVQAIRKQDLAAVREDTELCALGPTDLAPCVSSFG